MTIVLVCPDKDPAPWLTAFAEQAPQVGVEVWPNIRDKSAVRLALCWNHPNGSLLDFPNLSAICSMGAGVDHLLNDKKLPTHLPIARIIDPNLSKSMFEYLLTAVMDHISALPKYRQQQKWQWQRQPAFHKTHIGILGLGQLGHYCAQKFNQLGFNVSGWSKHPKKIENITTYQHSQLADFLKEPDILICLLPLTDQTKGILNTTLFNQLKTSSYLINVARGGHLIEDDLITALYQEQLSGACLDVFQQEPLPENHPFWQIENITITPHCSSLTRPKSVARQIIENYHLMMKDKTLNNLVDINQQY